MSGHALFTAHIRPSSLPVRNTDGSSGCARTHVTSSVCASTYDRNILRVRRSHVRSAVATPPATNVESELMLADHTSLPPVLKVWTCSEGARRSQSRSEPSLDAENSPLLSAGAKPSSFTFAVCPGS